MTSSDKKSLVKLVANFALTSSVSKIVRDQVRSTVVVETKADSAKALIGSFAIGSMIAERVWLNTEPKLDKAIEFVERHFPKKETEDATQ